MKRADCADLHFHDLRHEAVARFFERTKLQAMEFALIAGHTDPMSGQPELKLTPVQVRRFDAAWHGFAVGRARRHGQKHARLDAGGLRRAGQAAIRG